MARQPCDDKSSSGFCYSDVSSGNPTMLVNQIQGFVSDPEMYNLTTGMEMIGFPKSDTNAVMWRSFIPKPGPSSSKTINDNSTTFYHHDYNNKHADFTPAGNISQTSADNLIVGSHDSASWQDNINNNNNSSRFDDSSLRCVFPCETNERPSQGLSLSLSSTNPSSIGLQSFELRQTGQHLDFVSSSSRDGFFGKPVSLQQQQMVSQDGYVSSNSKVASVYQQGHFLVKNSKFLVPAQDLLNEFCSLDAKQSDLGKPTKSLNKKQWEEENNGIGSSKKHSLTSLEFVELQKRKTKLLSMLEEVDRRYKHYRNQMKSVVSSFEAVAGNGAATVYSALALKAMSRHFRCLKDGIMAQIQATRKAMGEKDPVAPGTTRGETPRLKVIDQTLRQQRAFQQMSMMETHPWRPQRGLPERAVSVLRAWLFEHFLHPYPSDVSNWFINARVRLWKPMVEEMYLEEVKDPENNIASSEGATDQDNDINPNNVEYPPPPSSSRSEDQKPSLVRIDSECASSIINNHSTPDNKNDPKGHEQCFGSVELDFSSYTHHSSGIVSYGSNDQNGNNNQSGVSLTLGLQQHGVSLAFPPATQSSLYYPRDQIEDCQPVQYSLFDGEGQNLPYRNLMGAQLLHDLAG
ncbi:Homeobox protein BEL1 [Glycine max]|nr:Homeobox protein BEL1 [Glycine max]